MEFCDSHRRSPVAPDTAGRRSCPHEAAHGRHRLAACAKICQKKLALCSPAHDRSASQTPWRPILPGGGQCSTRSRRRQQPEQTLRTLPPGSASSRRRYLRDASGVCKTWPSRPPQQRSASFRTHREHTACQPPAPEHSRSAYAGHRTAESRRRESQTMAVSGNSPPRTCISSACRCTASSDRWRDSEHRLFWGHRWWALRMTVRRRTTNFLRHRSFRSRPAATSVTQPFRPNTRTRTRRLQTFPPAGRLNGA